jgi:SEC-C motif-containing protein
MHTPCPCGSGAGYDDCCGRFLAGRDQAHTAEALMRSRYTAFVRQNANYLFATLHPAKRARDELRSLQKSFRGVSWTGLEILATGQGGAGDTSGTVEFRARFSANGQEGELHERSAFVQENGRWYYLDGEVLNAAAS